MPDVINKRTLPTDNAAFLPQGSPLETGVTRIEPIFLDAGQLKVTTTTYPDGLQLVAFDGWLDRPFELPIRDVGEYLSLAFVRHGLVTTQSSGSGFRFRAAPGTASLVRHGDFVGSARFETGGKLEVVSVCMPLDYLCALLPSPERLFPGASRQFAHRAVAVSPALRDCLDELSDCDLEGARKGLFLRAKAYELLTLAAESLDAGPGATSPALPEPVVRRATRARNILDQRLERPPTIPALARLVGTNDCRLKQDFKAVFRTTPHAYVVARRMEMAHALLSKGELSITATAQQVGYSNASHFSSAFQRHYGLLPRQVRRAAQ